MNNLKENPIMKWAAMLIAGILAAVAIGMGVLMTYSIMQRLFPGNAYMQIMSLAFFDGGALGWAGVYAYLARGNNQRAVSYWLFWLDLAGVVAMVIAEIYMGGQSLVGVPLWIGRGVVNTVTAVFAANLIAWYYFHNNAPNIREAIQLQALEARLLDETEQQTAAAIEREARALSQIMARRATARIKYRLALPMTTDERAEWEGETVDATAQDLPQLPAPADSYTPGWVQAFFGWLRGGMQQPQPQPEPITTTPNTDSNSNDEPQPQPDQNPPV